MKNYVVVDIETSGLDPTVHEVIEVGIVTDGGVEIAFSLDFNALTANPEALKVNGWGVREFAPRLTYEEAFSLMDQVFRDTMIVASPAHFDMGFLSALYNRHHRPIPWGHRSIIDLKSFTCGRLGLLTDLKNSEIGRLLDIEDTSNHSALDDAKWTHNLFQGLLAL